MIKVRHIKTYEEFYLVGTGYGMYKSSRPGLLFGNLDPHEEEGAVGMVAVCDDYGVIKWFNSRSLRVIEIDGITIQPKEGQVTLSCPACGSQVSENDLECPDCGIGFIDG